MELVNLSNDLISTLIEIPIVQETVCPIETFQETVRPADIIETTEEDHELCVQGYSDEVPCADPSGYFSVDNLFGELITDYQKLVARKNLGISDEHALKWGSISGNIANLEDILEAIENQVSIAQQVLQNSIDNQIANLDITELGNRTTVYYGSSIDTLTLSTSRTFSVNSALYIYVAVPDNTIPLSVNGIIGGFTLVGIRTINGNVFYLFRSDNANLGTTSIKYGS